MIVPATGVDQAFYALTPEKILDAVEVEGRRATGYALSLNSLENRVYEVELEDESRIVAKFYRPGRWSEAALREEHAFLRELTLAEVPVVAPLEVAGETLRAVDVGGASIWCALFPKVRGRPTEEPGPEQLAILGRLLARLHAVGASATASQRRRLDPACYGRASVEAILSRGHLPRGVRSRYADAAARLVDRIEPVFAALAPEATHHRIHADCHHGNLLWDRSGPFFLDFDDFTVGPAVQDLWLLTPGRDEESLARRALLVEAYEEMRDFDRRSLRLIEPLRALRILRYAAWIGARYEDPAFQRAFPDYADEAYWQREAAVLDEQAAIIDEAAAGAGS